MFEPLLKAAGVHPRPIKEDAYPAAVSCSAAERFLAGIRDEVVPTRSGPVSVTASIGAISVSESGTTSGETFTVTVSDAGVSHTYTATVNAAGTAWSATIPSTDAVALAFSVSQDINHRNE